MPHRRILPAFRDHRPVLTPLVGVVMCLVPVLWSVTRIVAANGDECGGIQLPQSSVGRPIYRSAARSPLMLLNVRERGGQLLVTGTYSERDKGPREIKAAKLPGWLRSAKAENPDVGVLVVGERSMSYGGLERVLKSCADAGIGDVRFRVRRIDSAGSNSDN